MTGALIMGLSRALYEEVAFDKGRVTSLDWVTYPMLRFKDHPTVTTVVVQRTRPAVDRLGRAADCRRRRGDRERVLRRHGRPHPRGADDAGARPGDAQGRGRRRT